MLFMGECKQGLVNSHGRAMVLPSMASSPISVGALVLLVASASAQQQRFTAPAGFEQVEGPVAVQFLNPFSNAAARFQYVDAAQRGTPRPGIVSLELRRDGTQPTFSPARAVDVEWVMAETDATNLSTNFTTNYVPGTAVTVFTRKNLFLPDHSPLPPSVPAAFDVLVPFDAPFSYGGQKDLLWEVRIFANQATSQAFSLDAADSVVPGLGSYAYLGFQSCATSLGPYWIHAIAPQTDSLGIARISVWAEHAPPLAPTVLAIGLGDSGFADYLCAPLRSSADWIVPVASSATGSVGTAQAPIGLQVPISAPQDFYLQFASLDLLQAPNLLVALSDAALYSALPYMTEPRVYRLFALGSATASVGTLTDNFVPIARFTY